MCTVGAGAHSRVKMILTVYLHFLTPTLVKLAGPARAWSRESSPYEEPRREDGFIVGSKQQSKACNEHAGQRARERCYMSL
jgi:hypothetical protein